MTSQSSSDWAIDVEDEVGRGGFGRVVAAIGPDGAVGVAKLVPKQPGADRELLVARLPSSQHVVPILEVSETETDWVLIMPRATCSLRDRMLEGPLELEHALDIAAQVAAGLAHLASADPVVVHRDLKPENVLLLDGAWAICDFGIARYAEATTAIDTHKYAWSSPYAAPEQWRQERATPATDIYALGVLTYESCTGYRPFAGPDWGDFREQHLHNLPPEPSSLPKRLQAILLECLHKAPEARPPAQNLIPRLGSALEELHRPGAAALAEAQRLAVIRQAQQMRLSAEARTEAERRTALAQAARATLQLLARELVDSIVENAPAAQIKRRDDLPVLRLGEAVLEIEEPIPADSAILQEFAVDLDVIMATRIQVHQAQSTYIRSHSLWYCDWETPESYAWYELSFMTISLSAAGEHNEPFDLFPKREAAVALSNVMGAHQLARAAVPLRPGDFDDFIDRWSEYVAQASQGLLLRPHALPEGAVNDPRRGRR